MNLSRFWASLAMSSMKLLAFPSLPENYIDENIPLNLFFLTKYITISPFQGILNLYTLSETCSPSSNKTGYAEWNNIKRNTNWNQSIKLTFYKVFMNKNECLVYEILELRRVVGDFLDHAVPIGKTAKGYGKLFPKCHSLKLEIQQIYYLLHAILNMLKNFKPWILQWRVHTFGRSEKSSLKII